MTSEPNETNAGGRPAIGNPVHVRLGAMLAQVDDYGTAQGSMTRADAVRHLTSAGLGIPTVQQALDVFAELEGQDKGYTIEMAQRMLSDLMNNGLQPVLDYVKHYCDVLDSDEDAERIAGYITGAAPAATGGES